MITLINHPFLDQVYFGNSLRSFLFSVVILLVSVTLLIVFDKIILKQLKKWASQSSTQLDDILVGILNERFLPIGYVLTVYFAVSHLQLHSALTSLIQAVVVIMITYQSARLIISVLIHLASNQFKRKDQKGSIVSRSILTIIKVVVWGMSFVFVLDNLGFDVNAVIAGLGIGGIAVALAAQTILGDLFNYFVIFFDRPFEEGDFVIVDDQLGVIEHVGIKSTRICSLGGEQIVFSNSDLMSSRIRNYKKMAKRRVVFKVGVVYQTSLEKMKSIPGMIKEIIGKIPDAFYDRCHFKSFGDYSLDIETVFYVMGSDYNKYMDIQEKINLEVMELFEKKGIEFAYPTQTLFVTK